MKVAGVVSLIIAGTLSLLVATNTVTVDELLYYFPCDHPISYHLGSVDPRFNLAKNEAETDITKATNLWNVAGQKQLFVEDQNSKLTINFIYDERQGLANQINSLENKANSDKTALNARIDAFNAAARDFQTKVAALNAEIDSWNKKGGAPKDVYDNLKNQQNTLAQISQKLQAEATSLNQSTKSFNFQINQLNGQISDFNSILTQKPEEGIYDGNKNVIEIYFNNSKNELIHTLAHEFGHALRIGHVQNPNAIMYSFTSETLDLTKDDTAGLDAACQKISRWEIIQGNVLDIVNKLLTQQPS